MPALVTERAGVDRAQRAAHAALGAYARRAPDVDRLILACFVFGVSTCKVAKTPLPLLGIPVSPATVSRVADTLDAAVEAFHKRPLSNPYQVLMLDGVVLIGVERGGPERAAPKSARVAGIRSFGIIGLLGGLWAQLASQVGAVVLGFAFVAFAPVMAIARWRSSHKNRRGGVDPGARAS